jgi:BirA family biotin operon repressor/biotin-[acetyl-CoA-carboxylase] ligase
LTGALGRPRLHLRAIGSTQDLARRFAAAGAPHGTLVTTAEQTAGRGRQGRGWVAPAGKALLMSMIVRDPDPLLPLRAGLAVADLAGGPARVKWPNDVLLDGRKVAGILVEGRPQEAWAALGMGINVAVDATDLPPELRTVAGTLSRPASRLDEALAELLAHLERRLGASPAQTIRELRERDALLGAPVRWAGGTGVGAGIADSGALRVRRADGSEVALDAGEVHLT